MAVARTAGKGKEELVFNGHSVSAWEDEKGQGSIYISKENENTNLKRYM